MGHRSHLKFPQYIIIKPTEIILLTYVGSMEMITLIKKQEVLLIFLREVRPQREITNKTEIDRKTVSKYID
jgi:hypothetical protein